MLEWFTERSLQAVTLAKEEAGRFNHNHVGTEHLLLGLLREGKNVAALSLNSLNIGLDEVREQLGSIAGNSEDHRGDTDLTFTPRLEEVFQLARVEARRLERNYVGTEHLLLGLLREPDGGAVQILSKLDVEQDRVRREVMRALGENL